MSVKFDYTIQFKKSNIILECCRIILTMYNNTFHIFGNGSLSFQSARYVKFSQYSDKRSQESIEGILSINNIT